MGKGLFSLPLHNPDRITSILTYINTFICELVFSLGIGARSSGWVNGRQKVRHWWARVWKCRRRLSDSLCRDGGRRRTRSWQGRTTFISICKDIWHFPFMSIKKVVPYFCVLREGYYVIIWLIFRICVFNKDWKLIYSELFILKRKTMENWGGGGGSWHTLFSMHLPVKRTWLFVLH